MLQESISLYNLLEPDNTPDANSHWQQTETKEAIEKIHHSLEKEMAGLDWKTVKQEIYQQLDSLLDISLTSVLTKVWLTSKQVKKIINKQNNEMKGDIVVIPLPTHKIKSLHKPKLKVISNNKEIGVIPLTAKFIFKLSGVLLKIQYGKIQAILAGQCQGAGSLSYQTVLLQDTKITAFDLSKKISAVKTHQQRIAEEQAPTLDVLTESRTQEINLTDTATREDTAAQPTISIGKKVTFMIIGILISFFVIIAIMLLM